MSVRLTKLVKRDLGVDPEITGVTADSRKVKPGFLFAALPGSRADGAAFAAKAVEAGAAAIIADQDLNLAVPTVVFYDPAHAHLGRHLVRFAFCKRDEVLGDAVERLRGMS